MVVLVAMAKFKFLLFGRAQDLPVDVPHDRRLSMLFGWRFAVGFVVLLLVHEMGHVLAATGWESRSARLFSFRFSEPPSS